MKKKVFAWALVVAMIAALAVGCAGNTNKPADPGTTAPADPGTSTPAAGEQVLRICHVSPRSGSAANYGFFMHHASEMAVKEINDAGGFKGPNGETIKIEYHQIDETSNSAQTVEAVQKAVSLKPHVILGPNRSGGVTAAENVWSDAKIPTITDPTGTNTNNTDYTFRMQIASPYWVPLLVQTAVERYDMKRPAIISGLNDYSEAMMREMEPALEKYGLKFVAQETFNDGDTDFSAQLLAIKNANPDALFAYAYTTELGLIFRQRMDLDMGSIRVYSERSTSVPEVIKIAGIENYNGIVSTTTLSLGDPDTKVQDFFKKYTEMFPDDGGISPTHINHYDSVYIIKSIVEKVGLDTEKITAELAALKDFQGTLGVYTSDSKGDLVHHMFTQIYEDDQWKLLDKMEFPIE